jgi:hypothetical protein
LDCRRFCSGVIPADPPKVITGFIQSFYPHLVTLKGDLLLNRLTAMTTIFEIKLKIFTYGGNLISITGDSSPDFLLNTLDGVLTPLELGFFKSYLMAKAAYLMAKAAGAVDPPPSEVQY